MHVFAAAATDGLATDPITYAVLVIVGGLALLFSRYVMLKLKETLAAVSSPKGRTVLSAADEVAGGLGQVLEEVQSLRREVKNTTDRQDRTERFVGVVDDRVNGIGERVERVERSTARAHERIDRIIIPASSQPAPTGG